MKDARCVGRMGVAMAKVALGVVVQRTGRGGLTALACVAIALSGPALAGHPYCNTSGVTPGVYPAFIKVVQLDNSGQADPSGRICFTLRDALGNPFHGGRAELEFSNCCDINICDFVPSPNPYFQEHIGCVPPRISARSDPSGQVCFVVVGAGKNSGTTTHPGIFPGAGLDCVKILLGAVGVQSLCDSATAVAFDQNGATGLVESPAVNAADQAILATDIGAIILFGRPYMGRDDYFADGAINSADQAELANQVFRASAAGGGVGSVNACPGQTYCKTKVQSQTCSRQ